MCLKCSLVRWPDPEPFSIVGQDFHRLDVLSRLAGHYRMSPAGIIATHTADGATAVRGRVRAERQTLERSSALQLVADDARLNHGGPAFGVKLFNPGQVTRRVDNHRNVHGLTAHRRARAACEYGYIRLMACTH